MIELAGDFEFDAPQELVWEMLLDPEVMARIIPGCETLEKIDENTYQGQLTIRVGPVQGVFQGKVEHSDIQPTNSFHIIINGRGPAGVVGGEGNLTLESTGPTTRLNYEGAAQVSGRMATVGQRLMDSSAKSIVKQSLQNLEKQIQFRLEPELTSGIDSLEDSPAVAPAAAPSQTEFMVNVTRDVIEDLIPDPQQRRVLVGLGLIVVIIGLVNGFANLVARRVAKTLKEE